MKKYVDGVLVDLTADEETQRSSEVTAAKEHHTQRNTNATNLENLKTSAKAKLIAGEALTEDEANTIVL